MLGCWKYNQRSDVGPRMPEEKYQSEAEITLGVTGMLKYWNTGMLEYWNAGILECDHIGNGPGKIQMYPVHI